jgi:hypothetical protein
MPEFLSSGFWLYYMMHVGKKEGFHVCMQALHIMRLSLKAAYYYAQLSVLIKCSFPYDRKIFDIYSKEVIV